MTQDQRLQQLIAETFRRRKKDLEQQLSRLLARKEEGWGYRRVRRRKARVPAHTRKAHWAMVPVRGDK